MQQVIPPETVEVDSSFHERCKPTSEEARCVVISRTSALTLEGIGAIHRTTKHKSCTRRVRPICEQPFSFEHFDHSLRPNKLRIAGCLCERHYIGVERRTLRSRHCRNTQGGRRKRRCTLLLFSSFSCDGWWRRLS